MEEFWEAVGEAGAVVGVAEEEAGVGADSRPVAAALAAAAPEEAGNMKLSSPSGSTS